MNKSAEPQTPYDDLKGTPLWQAVEKSIIYLATNGDLLEQTPREYIVGYICRQVAAL